MAYLSVQQHWQFRVMNIHNFPNVSQVRQVRIHSNCLGQKLIRKQRWFLRNPKSHCLCLNCHLHCTRVGAISRIPLVPCSVGGDCPRSRGPNRQLEGCKYQFQSTKETQRKRWETKTKSTGRSNSFVWHLEPLIAGKVFRKPWQHWMQSKSLHWVTLHLTQKRQSWVPLWVHLNAT